MDLNSSTIESLAKVLLNTIVALGEKNNTEKHRTKKTKDWEALTDIPGNKSSFHQLVNKLISNKLQNEVFPEVDKLFLENLLKSIKVDSFNASLTFKRITLET